MRTGTAGGLSPEEETTMALACALYERGAWAESFRLLLRLSAAGKRTAPLLYNKALCLERAGRREEALSCLENALACLKSGKREWVKPSGEEAALQTLYEQQCAKAQYRFPMREEEAACLPDYARERVLRLMIDLYAQQKDGARVRGLAASLPGKHFDNLERALRETAEKEM